MATWICGRGCTEEVTQKTGHPGQCKVHGETYRYPKALGANGRKPMRSVSPKRELEEATGKRPRQRGSTLKRSSAPETSPAQRKKVRGRPCAGCGREGHVDPAHVWPRAHGGCLHPDCVIPLCRTCHRAFDQGELDLLSRFADSEGWAVEQARPILKHGVGLVELVRRLSGNGYEFIAVGHVDKLRARVAELEGRIAA
jgi:hypothetical protein